MGKSKSPAPAPVAAPVAAAAPVEAAKPTTDSNAAGAARRLEELSGINAGVDNNGTDDPLGTRKTLTGSNMLG